MAAAQVVEGLWQINLGAVNAYLLDQGELTLLDTGIPKSEGKIAAAIQGLGKKPTDVRHIVVTHCHPDHSGSLAALKRLTGATVYMHATDAAMVRKGEGKRPMTPAPGILRGLMYRLFVAGNDGKIEASAVDREINDGMELPIAGGLKAIHVPGHCAGQLAFLWPRRRLLFAADACANMPNFGYALSYEDLALGNQSLRKLSALDFDVACFGHGKPITTGASQKFREKWSA